MLHKQEATIGSKYSLHIVLLNEIKWTLTGLISFCVTVMWVVMWLSIADIKKEISSLDLSKFYVVKFY